MPTSYTALLGLALPVTGELSGTWGDVVSNYITQYVDSAVAGTQTISGSQTAVTLSVTNGSSLVTAGSGATGSAQFQIINCTGNPAGLLTITAPASSRQYIIINATSTSQSVKIVGTGPTTGVTILSGEKAHVAWNGSDFVKIATQSGNGSFVDLTVSGSMTLSGGTANGVLYLNGSKVATSGSALTFDGTSLGVGIASPTFADGKGIHINNAIGSARLHLTSQTSGSASTDGSEFTVAGSDLYIINNESAATIFYNAGSEQMRLTSTGLGIGTSSPGTNLHIGSGSSPESLGVTLSRGAVTNFYLAYDGTKTFIAGTDPSESYAKVGTLSSHPVRLVAQNGTGYAHLDTSGNLGLGVTPSAWGSSVKALQVGSGAALYDFGSSNVAFGSNVYFDGTNNRYINTDSATYYQQNNGTHIWATAASGTAGTNISFTQAMTLDASGNLGVGVTSVTAPGASRQGIQVASAAGGAVLLGQSATATNNARVLGANSGAELLLAGGAGNPVTIYTDGSERARITSGGVQQVQ